jgi:hypothetical protein
MAREIKIAFYQGRIPWQQTGDPNVVGDEHIDAAPAP